VLRVPSPAEEDAERQHRERQVKAERTGHGNRISGLLMALGTAASIRAEAISSPICSIAHTASCSL
jgi:hypothetical protein